ncbi:uncharacterized protein LOC122382459 [Amphibalanus amphitrite]|uniref:uncharacterized protein LOC122382459 n=1 Tax=Amphibalanus amphitrite TaxID=1232801 RepID=UPI001C91BED0|nr:uncharacterized protein LOC122382459 [Amphibalanus amphitrite]
MRVVSLLPLSALLLALGVSRCVGQLMRHGDAGQMRAAMGVSSADCDDAQTGLEMDWDGSADEYTCSAEQSGAASGTGSVLESKLERMCLEVPADFQPEHICMNVSIEYTETIPTTVNHRPLWAVYGEYTYLPPQRWTHNIEHGAVVMLYHPCADSTEVDKLKQLVRGCIRKHVITPYNKLPMEQPLALATWGCHLHMAEVDEAAVRSFIRETALQGTEGHLSREGQYDYMLVQKAQPPVGSDIDDSVLCPNQP